MGSRLIDPVITYRLDGIGLIRIVLTWVTETNGTQTHSISDLCHKNTTAAIVTDIVANQLHRAASAQTTPTHTYKSVDYTLLSRNVKLQVNDEWVPAVSYTNSSGITFIRTATEFDSKFKELT